MEPIAEDTIITSLEGASSILPLLYLSSPALPIGAFAYSQGLEYAIDEGWVSNQKELAQWCKGVMQFGLGRLDLPILLRCYQGWLDNDKESLEKWNQFVLASRETAELEAEDIQLGKTLGKLLVDIDHRPPYPIATASYVIYYAFAAQSLAIPVQQAAQGFLWSWLENQTTVACKTIPLGQTAAQKILIQLLPEIPKVVDYAMTIVDNDIGATLPVQAIASAKHETQYSRLFRS
ncbi:MAG: urease accessory protein UreF [Kangiellaceae bacterium]|jgi:urease accessory protein|nr:urease accessory protein UreF [Kangiellaceae bacterium]|tara:strand:- start:1017 stop:1718 length:702 start_codon:yes stop_codon:yes gene_type:complete